ncbi:MAG: HAD-IIB family hydrolase [Candidatus Promineifilaceae bacterium]
MGKKLWLFVSDVDGTLLGDDEALGRLSAELKKAADRVTVVFNSSRPCASLRESLSAVPHLPPPDYLIGGMGTEIEIGRTGERLSSYERHLNKGWNREKTADLVAGLDAVPHLEKFQTPFKVSFDIPDSDTYREVQQRLADSGLAAKAIFSAGRFLDLIAANGGKGEAIRFLQKQVGVPPEQVVVAGDSGNDVEMFVSPFRGIIVGNADKDLMRLSGSHIYKATQFHAGGLLEGLHYWGVLT